MTTTTTPAASPLKIRLDNVRIAFPKLYLGDQVNGEGQFRCGAQLIITPDHPQLATVRTLMDGALKAKWKDKWEAHKKNAIAKGKLCLQDGDLKAKWEGFAGNFTLSANCPNPAGFGDTAENCKKPKVYDAQRNLVEKDTGLIYSGCYVNALVEFYAHDRFGDGVFCSLLGVQFAKDGDAFAGSSARADDFESASEGADAGEFV